MFKRIILLVMDSVGIGHAADATKFGDEGSNTLGHIESTAGQIHCPNLKSIGLDQIADISEDVYKRQIENRMDTINKKFKFSYIVGGIALVISILEFFIIWS